MKQWKRLAALSSAIVMAAATLTYFPNDTLQNIRLEISASAEDASAVTWTKTESDGLTWTLYEDGTLNISGTGEMRGYNAYSIKSPACDNSNIKNVVIEDGITSIGSFAFYGCSLTNIRIPGSVTSIGNCAIEDCMSLTSVTIPGSVSSIGEYAFRDCRNLTDATILDGVTSIENRAFWGCSSLTSVTIPNSVTNIGESAFWNCNKLTSVTIPDGVTSIEDLVFSSCYSLTSITIPNSVTSIGNRAFRSCTKLTSITIPDGVISIGNFAFSGCNELTSITIPDSVTSIGDSAFEECRILTSISIPDSVTSIGGNVFKNCTRLKTISLSCKSSLKKSDFGEQANLVSASHILKKTAAKAVTCTENGNKEYWTCEHCGKYFLSDDTNPETAKAVELSETVIPASHKLTKVEAKAPTCTEDGNKEYWTCEHCGKYFLSDDANPETAKAVEQSEFIIPALNHKNAIIQNASEPTETAPGYSGDRYCPDCDKVVEKGYTYWNEGNLTWKLYEDGTLNISGTGAMKDYNDDDNPSPVYQNSNVKKVVIEKGVTSIGNYAFSGCLGLKSITIPDGITSIGDHAFDSCINLRSITLPDSITSIGMWAFYNCWNVSSIIIPDGVTSIEDFTFNSCISLTSITIPNSVTNIKSSAFHNCADLTSITIPDSVTSIGYAAFSNCDSLQTISLGCGSALKKSDFGDQANLVSYTNQHLLTKTEAKAKTCTEDGNKEYWTCEHCGKYFLSDDTNPETAKAVEQSEFIIPASHKLTKVEAKDATCTEDGNKAYWTCEHCGKYFLSDDSNPETATAVELSETVIPALKHKNATTRGVVEPNGTKPGYSGDRYCPDCDTVLEKGYTYWNEGNLTWTLDADGTLNISGTGAMKDYNAVGNLSPATQKKDSVKKVVIEKGVTSIENKAFHNCNSLTSITIPDSVTSIGDSAFSGCWDLTSITIPDSITTIGESAFSGCSGLTSITIPNSVTSIGAYAFSGCRSLTSITIPDSVTSIGNSSFSNCWYLTSITIPNSVTSIGTYAFSNCWYLTSITIPESVTSIGKSAFYKCSSLTTISLSCKSTLKKSDFGDQADLVSYTSHTLKKTKAKAATYAENGNKEYWTCEHCGKYFLSDDTNPETAKAVEFSEIMIPALVQVATATTPINAVYGQDMNKIDLRNYVKNTDVVGEVTVKVATGSTLPDGMKLDNGKISGKPAKAYEDGKEVTFTFTAENGNTANLTLLFLVAKAEPTVEVAVSGDSHTEGDLVGELELILSENSTKGVVELVSEIKALVAGKNTFTWKFTPEDENNYNTITGTVVVNAQTTTTTTTKATTTTTKATTTTKPSKTTTTTKATTTTKPNKTTTTKATTTTKPSKTTTTKVTTTTKPNKTTTTKVTTTTKPSKTTTTKATTTTKPSKTTTTKVTNTTKPSKTTTTKVTTTTKPSKTTTTKATTTTKPSKATTTNVTTKATTTTKPNKTTTTKATTTAKPSKTTTTTKATTTTKPSKATTTNVTTTTKPSKTTTTKVTTTTKPSKTTTTKVTTTTKPSKTTTTNATTTTKPSKTTTTKVTTTTKPSKTTTTKVTTTTKPSKTTTTKVTTTTKPSKTTTTKVTTTTKPSKTTTTNATTTTKPSKTTTTKATTTTKPNKTTTTKVTTTTKPSKTTTTKVTTTTKPSKTTTTNATTTNTAIPSYGDVNLDGKVDIVDAIFLNKYLATLIQFSDAQMANADCCQDGVLNDQDTTALMQFIILLIDDLPVQPTEK